MEKEIKELYLESIKDKLISNIDDKYSEHNINKDEYLKLENFINYSILPILSEEIELIYYGITKADLVNPLSTYPSNN